MMVISLTQRFFLCTETGSESVDIREEKGMFGLVAAALLELELSGCVCIEEKKVRVCAPLSEGCAPLAPLYNYIRRKGPVSVGKIARASFVKDILLPPLPNDSLSWQLRQSVGTALELRGLAQSRDGKKALFLPKPEAVQAEFAELRATLIDRTLPLDGDTAALALLLDKMGVLAEHFSAAECEQMRDALLTQAAEREENAAVIAAMKHFERLWKLNTALAFLPW